MLNEENEIQNVPPQERQLQEVTEKEVGDAFCSMKNDSASGPSGVPNELLKKAGKTGIRE